MRLFKTSFSVLIMFIMGCQTATHSPVSNKQKTHSLQQVKVNETVKKVQTEPTTRLVKRQKKVAKVAPKKLTQQKKTITKVIPKKSSTLDSNKSERLIQESLIQFEKSQYIDSAQKITQLQELNYNITADESVLTLKQNLVIKLHKQAIVFYHNNFLKQALYHWELILKLQPDNQLALDYYHRTQNLLNSNNTTNVK